LKIANFSYTLLSFRALDPDDPRSNFWKHFTHSIADSFAELTVEISWS